MHNASIGSPLRQRFWSKMGWPWALARARPLRRSSWRWAAECASGLRVTGVPTSQRTEAKAIEAGIALTTLSETPSLDLGVDGADEIDPYLNLVKGRGGALLYERIVAGACCRWVIVAAAEKQVDRLGTRVAVPVEVVPFGWEQTASIIVKQGFEPRLRTGPDGRPFAPTAVTLSSIAG